MKTGFRGRSESLTSKSGFKGANYHTPVNISVRKIGLGAEAGHRSEEERRVERYSLARLTGRKWENVLQLLLPFVYYNFN